MNPTHVIIRQIFEKNENAKTVLVCSQTRMKVPSSPREDNPQTHECVCAIENQSQRERVGTLSNLETQSSNNVHESHSTRTRRRCHPIHFARSQITYQTKSFVTQNFHFPVPFFFEYKKKTVIFVIEPSSTSFT